MPMTRGVRAPERAYNLLLWLLSFVIAGFIIGLGNLIIGDLPLVAERVDPDQFIDADRLQTIRDTVTATDTRRKAIEDELAIARLQLTQAVQASKTATEAFEAWISTRTATTDPRQDPEVLERTRQLEAMKAIERDIQSAKSALENEQLALIQQASALHQQEWDLRDAASPAYERVLFWQELKIFLWRLALTLPMLLIAAWMVARRRRSDHWPLMRGFVLAAVFVFFVELAPYLPSYGGYIRYGVGILLTIVAGHFLINNMRRYLARRAAAETQDEGERRKQVSRDEAFRKIGAKTCPGCDRPIAMMAGSDTNFCVHCGLTLYDHCQQCHARKMAFFRYCMACGAASAESGNPRAN